MRWRDPDDALSNPASRAQVFDSEVPVGYGVANGSVIVLVRSITGSAEPSVCFHPRRRLPARETSLESFDSSRSLSNARLRFFFLKIRESFNIRCSSYLSSSRPRSPAYSNFRISFPSLYTKSFVYPTRASTHYNVRKRRKRRKGRKGWKGRLRQEGPTIAIVESRPSVPRRVRRPRIIFPGMSGVSRRANRTHTHVMHVCTVESTVT